MEREPKARTRRKRQKGKERGKERGKEVGTISKGTRFSDSQSLSLSLYGSHTRSSSQIPPRSSEERHAHVSQLDEEGGKGDGGGGGSECFVVVVR